MEPITCHRICNHVQHIHDQGIQPQELVRTQRLLSNEYAFSTETPAQLASLYGYYQTIADMALAREYPQQVQAITAEQIQTMAQQYLTPNCYAVTALEPL